jgi:hypothetical protein
MTPPENAGYYHAAYAAAAIIWTAYAVSLWWRTRRVRERLSQETPDR